MFNNRWRFKWYLSMAIFSLAVSVILTDFDDLVFPGWGGLLKDIDSASGPQHGVRAAFLAICTAAILFVSMIPAGASRPSKIFDRFAQLLGGFLALGTGWYWLLGESDGNPFPYVIAFVPLTILMIVAMAFNLYLSFAAHEDRVREESAFDWRIVLVGVGLMVVAAATLYVMLKLPSLL